MILLDDSRAVQLDRDEVRYMMALFQTQALIGIDPQLLSGASPQAGRRSLFSRGLLQDPEQGKRADRVRGSLLRPALATLFPERALVVIRDAPSDGARRLIFLRRENVTVLHTLPRDGLHRWIELSAAEDGTNLLTEWFPLQNLPASNTNLIVPVETFEKFRVAAAQGQAESALQALFYLPIQQQEKVNLLRVVEHPLVSGSFALFTCGKETIISAESLAILASSETAWAITRPAEDSAGDTYRIRRTGPDLPGIFSRMFAWLTG